jgi:hypothetical protein
MADFGDDVLDGVSRAIRGGPDGTTIQPPRSPMPQTVEIRLRIPSLRVPAGDAPASVIANDDVRFSKRIEVDRIPKPGDILDMTASSGATFPCKVVRSDWHEGENCFVVACQYAKRSITHDDYQALTTASDWHVRPLL